MDARGKRDAPSDTLGRNRNRTCDFSLGSRVRSECWRGVGPLSALPSRYCSCDGRHHTSRQSDRRLFAACIVQWECDREGASEPRLGYNVDAPAVSLHDAMGDAEAQTEPLHIASGGRHPIEAVEEVG